MTPSVLISVPNGINPILCLEEFFDIGVWGSENVECTFTYCFNNEVRVQVEPEGPTPFTLNLTP